MTIEERAARAVELKASCNCAQAVVLSYADKLPLEEETLKKLAAGYGGGMGCMEGTCGALVGAVMVAGMLTDGAGAGQRGDPRPGCLECRADHLRNGAGGL